tara:strand:+ start:818 stop:1465 length:648 start_codon:yes stop_codon:yes gene_type:complete
MSEIIWGQSESVQLPEFDVCWTSPPYEMHDLSQVTSHLHKAANPGALLWLMHPGAARTPASVDSEWELLTHCCWCMTESDVDKAYTARGPLEVTHDIWLFHKRDDAHYWKPDYWMPNWLAGGLPEKIESAYLPVPTEVIQECLGASLPSEGKSFLDPFCGTATSVCAAHEMGFAATGIEKDEETCKKARMRLKSLGIVLPSERHTMESAAKKALE